ncbi:19219_t:CDS:2 [Dentiscutata erythropus]|uniref:19219_t:CDS:1 n=1 Tax=Dentiscutata erythropus TaxID=1348616 RepID=A0A9N9J701_9GLOM|nr:19219_t:CDS:2 [Dentiscutata erythropus]
MTNTQRQTRYLYSLVKVTIPPIEQYERLITIIARSQVHREKMELRDKDHNEKWTKA